MILGLRCLLSIVLLTAVLLITEARPVLAQSGAGVSETVEVEEVLEVKEPEIGPNPQRLYCAEQWTSLYERQKAEIIVTTRGQYNEIAVFDCPDCSLEENFVIPFLENEYRGKTGMMRLYECGYTKAIFEGFRGTQDIVVEVQQVFPDPDRLPCAVQWDNRYKKLNTGVDVFARGEFNETIVFSCYYCTSQKSFIIPFLLQEYKGRTAMQRMKECGFTEVVFTDPKGRREVTKKVR